VKEHLEEAEYQTTVVTLDRIHCVKNKPKRKRVENKPLVLLKSSKQNCILTMEGNKPSNSKPFVCYSGNLRLLQAEQLGYEAIDCIIADDIYWARAIEIALN
tara:strand:- start:1201 stop:1506 length:306 start_codon:yes stop_codon:yes gene_type:complete